MLSLQRSAGNAAARAMLQRLIKETDVRTEAERLWIRKGRPDQTTDEGKADWELATRNIGEMDVEARQLWEAKGSPMQNDVDQQKDWAAALHTVRQRRLAEDVWKAKGSPQNQGDPDKALDWATAGAQLEIEELWERCNPDLRLPGEDPAAVPARVAQAKTDLGNKPGFRANMIDALLLHDHARSPRPFTTVTAEDALGLGGHIATKHVRAAGTSDDDERRKQAMRVVTHEPAYGGYCPGKAGSFADLAAADTALKAALKLLWSQNGGWGAPNGWRNKLARGENAMPGGGGGFWGFQGTLPVVAQGFVQERNPHPPNAPFPVAQRPAYLADPAAMGGRPLFTGDPIPIPANKGGVAVVLQPASELTLNVVPTGVTIRVNATPNAAAEGWTVNSAWPT